MSCSVAKLYWKAALAHISLFSSCLDDMCFGESRVLKSPTINVWGLMCDLSFSNVSFTNVGALAFEALMFKTESSLFPEVTGLTENTFTHSTYHSSNYYSIIPSSLLGPTDAFLFSTSCHICVLCVLSEEHRVTVTRSLKQYAYTNSGAKQYWVSLEKRLFQAALKTCSRDTCPPSWLSKLLRQWTPRKWEFSRNPWSLKSNH